MKETQLGGLSGIRIMPLDYGITDRVRPLGTLTIPFRLYW